jgi:hypothetical protein
MSQPTNAAGGDRPPHFDAAEPTGASEPLACTACGTTIRGYYHEANGAVVCSSCRRTIEQRLRGGSSIGRFARAMTFGSGAALVGATLYFGIALAFGIELGLIAIVVGWMVGRAVNAGTRGRGGWRYQAMAIALTYSAIVVTYMPAAIERSMDPATLAALDSLAPDSSVTGAEAAPSLAALAPAATTPEDSSDAAAAAAAASVPRGLAIVLGVMVMFVLAWAEPFRLGMENVMGLVIIAIGLYQAWLQNRAAAMSLTGPYAIGSVRSSGTP